MNVSSDVMHTYTIGPDAKYSLQLYMSTHKALVSASLCHPIYDMVS